MNNSDLTNQILVEESYNVVNKNIITYDTRYSYTMTDKSIAQEIRNRYNDICTIEKNNIDFDFVEQFHKKITSHTQMIKDILTYEFLFYDPVDKVYDLQSLMVTTISELAKYQGIIGGYNIEDSIWLQCTSEVQNRFKLKSNQFAIYNSCDSDACYDKDQKWFLKNFVKHMKKWIGSDNLTIDYKLYDDETNEICWILIVCEDRMNNYNFNDDFNDDNNGFSEGEGNDDDSNVEPII